MVLVRSDRIQPLLLIHPDGKKLSARIKICPAGGSVIIHRHSGMLSEYSKTTQDALLKAFFGNIHICAPFEVATKPWSRRRRAGCVSFCCDRRHLLIGSCHNSRLEFTMIDLGQNNMFVKISVKGQYVHTYITLYT